MNGMGAVSMSGSVIPMTMSNTGEAGIFTDMTSTEKAGTFTDKVKAGNAAIGMVRVMDTAAAAKSPTTAL